MKRSSQYKFSVEPFTEDYCGNLSWGRLGNLLLRCASMHAGEHGFGFSDMLKSNQGWVLSRLVMEMDALPRSGETFYIETWVSKIYRQFTDRHFSILREDGSAYGHATSIWALIDQDTRIPADLTQLADGGFTDALIPERPSPIAPMGRIRMKSPILADKHQAAFTDLDINGHVNSIRYIELLLNQYAPEDLKKNPVKRIEMAYCLESYHGNNLDIYKDGETEQTDSQTYEIRKDGGDVVVKGKISF